ncbi:decarboxylating 6-phosphogluconate dehydrogenase [Candidatus Woesearchaeota archaeon]|nr:decarboxylating 6-phosphogluconate dehydrogenase [Candidatus Woesearchaeota archaeon]
MEIGFIGLGKMGANMVKRMLKSKKIKVVVWNRSPKPVKQAVKNGATGAKNVSDLVLKLKSKRKVVWLMLPAGKVTEDKFQEVLGLLNKNDVIIDGANSNFHDTLRRHKEAKKKGISMLDVGVSGGIIAANKGYPMMIGGEASVYKYVKPIFDSFGIKEGYDLVGPGGAGHYVKMIHNAIEYGMMQAISEGVDLLENGRVKNLDLQKISHIWNNGTIISSFLMEMTENALKKSPKLNYLKPYVEDSGEGKWSAIEAMEFGVPFVVNTYALHARYQSRDKNSFAFRMLAAMRNEFGGHAIKK